MRLLLDTQALLCWLTGDSALPSFAKKFIRSRVHTVMVSAAPAWEISSKSRLGMLPGGADLAPEFDALVAAESFESLAISVRHGCRAGMLPGPLRDCFDRRLFAQAQSEGLTIAYNDKIIDECKVPSLWD